MGNKSTKSKKNTSGLRQSVLSAGSNPTKSKPDAKSEAGPLPTIELDWQEEFENSNSIGAALEVFSTKCLRFLYSEFGDEQSSLFSPFSIAGSYHTFTTYTIKYIE
jgi:hypothetical protein